MKIVFADPGPWDYNVQTPYQSPLGGSHSAACYLAEALARMGHEVTLLNATTQPGVHRGVNCVSRLQATREVFKEIDPDVAIVILSAGAGQDVRSMLPAKTKLVLWTQHAPDQPGVRALATAEERNAYDGIVLVSDWHRQVMHAAFGLDERKTVVLRNAISPAFANLFEPGQPIVPFKMWPPVLTYTSTPFRGLDVLLQLFPQIRKAVPGTRLAVFSSLRVYQQPDAEDQFAPLYEACRRTEGVEYYGSIAQPQLAAAMRQIMLLSYPNTFPETSCISAMEAMAAGCRIVTSELGALPETTAGFASLIPIGADRMMDAQRFIDTAVALLRQVFEVRNMADLYFRSQVEYANANYTWTKRAADWTQWLKQLVG